MPLIKIGESYYNERKNDVFLIQGNATRDGEMIQAGGKDLGKVSVAAKDFEDGGTMFVTVNGWRGRAAYVSKIRKMDSVLAVGVLKSREYNDKKYYDLDADFVIVSGAGEPEYRSAGSYYGGGVDVTFEEYDAADGELPF